MKKFIFIVDKLSLALGKITAFFVSAVCILIFMEIILRTFFNITLFITSEYAGYTMSIITFLGLAYTLYNDGHIRVTILYEKFSEKKRIICDCINYFIGFMLCIYIFRATGSLFYSSLVKQTRSIQVFATYLAIPQFFLPLGVSVMMLQYMCKFIKSLDKYRRLEGEK